MFSSQILEQKSHNRYLQFLHINVRDQLNDACQKSSDPKFQYQILDNVL